MKETRRQSWVRKFSRVSLKMSLVMVTLVAVAMAWVGDAWHQRQREAALVTRMGQELKRALRIDRPSLNSDNVILM
jgi:hypothetical protein